ncbi:hypothetical protein ACH4LQ_11170 [Streptomyces globisporus]|uniref:hypothetical protein n=1 Tax=Streptomyces globisporus TaxID=1908 RepID=UPI00379E04D3
MAAANALTAREATVKATKAKEEADVTARETAAAGLRLFDNDTELVSDPLGVPAEDPEREGQPVPPLGRRRSSNCCGPPHPDT